MGDYSRLDDDDISINPPLTWRQIKDSPFLDKTRDAYLLVEEITKDTETGKTIEMTSSFIVPNRDSGQRTYYSLESQIQEIVKAFPKNRFEGLIKASTEGFDADESLWGIWVSDGQVMRVRPTITWPVEG